MAKKTWKDRLVKEEKKLDKKVDTLSAFIEGEYGNFDELSEIDQDLLMVQHAAMTTYLNILTIKMKKHGLKECHKCKKAKDDLSELLNEMLGEDDGRNS